MFFYDQNHSENAYCPNQVIAGNYRFSIIERRIIRMEWCADGKFEDRPSLNIGARDLGEVAFCQTSQDKWMVLDTGALRLMFQADGKAFSPENLRIEWAEGSWVPNQVDPQNLGGTASELDMCDGYDRIDLAAWLNNKWVKKSDLKFNHGLLSSNGWSIFDDSKTALLQPHPAFGEWFQYRPQGERQDLYFFGFGHQYKEALRLISRLFGSQPLPPRYAFGYWYSRYWAYSDRDLEELTARFRESGTPLDVLVLDLDWHLPGWTGFTWDSSFFPAPTAFLRKMHRNGLKITLNLHPDRGVAPHESKYPILKKAIGLSAQDETIPFQPESPTFMDAYFRHILQPEEKRGVDFWWLDWRMGEGDLSLLGWVNRLHWLDQLRTSPDRRPMIFSCNGGADAGRFPVGFSADACATWATLNMEIDFTARAANVLFGYWSNDIGGHIQDEAITPELYLRWMQFGVFSPVLRTHSAKFDYAERCLWNFSAPYNTLLRETVLLRYRLIPYVYTECRKGCDDGISLCRPLYYEFPEEAESYRRPGEYFFGSEIIAAPVGKPMDPETLLAESDVWLPPGKWFDLAAGRLLTGGREYHTERTRAEIPLFIRAGAVIPEQNNVQCLGRERSIRNLVLTIFPGDSGEYELYEDDGQSNGYRNSECSRIRINHHKNGRTRTIVVNPAQGHYPGMVRSRSLEFHLYGVVPPKSVAIWGKTLPFLSVVQEPLTPDWWSYDGDLSMIRVHLDQVSVRRRAIVKVIYSVDDEFEPAAGLRGAFIRLRRLAEIQNQVSGCTAPVQDDRLAQELAHAGRRLSIQPHRFNAELSCLKRKFPCLAKSFIELHKVRSQRYPFSLREVEALSVAIRKNWNDEIKEEIKTY